MNRNCDSDEDKMNAPLARYQSGDANMRIRGYENALWAVSSFLQSDLSFAAWHDELATPSIHWLEILTALGREDEYYELLKRLKYEQ